MKPGVYRWRDITKEKWERADLLTSLVACGTTIGVQKNKYVCGSEEVPDNFKEEAIEKVGDLVEKLLPVDAKEATMWLRKALAVNKVSTWILKPCIDAWLAAHAVE